MPPRSDTTWGLGFATLDTNEAREILDAADRNGDSLLGVHDNVNRKTSSSNGSGGRVVATAAQQ